MSTCNALEIRKKIIDLGVEYFNAVESEKQSFVITLIKRNGRFEIQEPLNQIQEE